MDATQHKYTLRYLANSEKLEKEDFKNSFEKICKEIASKKSTAQFEVNTEKQGKYIEIIIKTSDEQIVEACYENKFSQINSENQKKKHYIYEIYEVENTLAEELREKAYPILSKLEISIRNFILEKFIDNMGIDWINNDFYQYLQKNNFINSKEETLSNEHIINLSNFSSLIKILTDELQVWRDDKSLTPDDLKLLLKEESIEKIRDVLESKTSRKSWWDIIFSKYFNDKEVNKNEWIEVKKELEKVAQIRNKVMHHRRLSCEELEVIEKNYEKFNRLIINKTENNLPETDKRTINEKITDLINQESPNLKPSLNEELNKTLEILKEQPSLIELLNKTLEIFKINRF